MPYYMHVKDLALFNCGSWLNSLCKALVFLFDAGTWSLQSRQIRYKVEKSKDKLGPSTWAGACQGRPKLGSVLTAFNVSEAVSWERDGGTLPHTANPTPGPGDWEAGGGWGKAESGQVRWLSQAGRRDCKSVTRPGSRKTKGQLLSFYPQNLAQIQSLGAHPGPNTPQRRYWEI